MKYGFYITLTVLFVAATIVAAIIISDSPLIVAGLGLGAVVVTLLGYGSVKKQLRAVRSGFDLLRSQDFSSRLRKIGEIEADKIVEIFNRTMATMKAERLKLMEQNLLLGKLIDVSPLGIAICDFDGKIVEMNSVYKELNSTELEEVMLSLKADESRVVRLASSQIYRCSRLWFMDSGFQRTFYIVEVLTDDIIESERAVFNKIVRTIGHEVNNTLAPVISVLDSLEEMCGKDRIVSDAIRGSKDSCMNLVDFVKSYSGVVKLPAPDMARVELNDEMRKLMPVLQSVVGSGIKVELVESPEPVELEMDMVLIGRALVNVVKNSAESIGEKDGGEIRVCVEGRKLKIVDNGRGISDEVSSKLFTPFFSTKRPDRGLGLMLVAEILRAHNATFSLKTDLGSGLTGFEVEF